ncbi:MAG: DinB family protein, partial [Bryobacteraceae bacterium]
MAHRAVQQLLASLEDGYRKAAWHGPNLRMSLRGVTHEHAAWRPVPGAHNIWEYALHCAYWKFAVRRRLTGDTSAAFAVPGHNFFQRPPAIGDNELLAAEWRRDIALLARAHKELYATVAELRDAALDRRSAGSQQTPRKMIE